MQGKQAALGVLQVVTLIIYYSIYMKLTFFAMEKDVQYTGGGILTAYGSI